ncbi:hypothetical protein [Niabella hibiscisoli]|uniref:hypothetical protein n=1 Tax=Niabella hibiscisoli TaxID=1825928 RepID=UPI001F0F5BCE|nr:hypothetical protein [Niabella hibiscisoli]MCH5718017.1 hypothetical protein [Niabella hibiscisoli]
MKLLWTLCIALLCSLPLIAQEKSSGPRLKQLLNFDWKFHLGDLPGAQGATFNDAQWQKLDLPHDFQINQPWVESGEGPAALKPWVSAGIAKLLKLILHGKERKCWSILKVLWLPGMYG